MSKDRYNDDHTIEIFGDEGKQTLFVKENLRVHSTTWTDELICESLDAEEIFCDNLTVRDTTVLGTGQTTDTVTVKAVSTFEKDATFEKKVTFLGSIDASDVPYGSFKANGFKSMDGAIAIRAGENSSDGNITLSAYNDIDLKTTRSSGIGNINLESDKIVIKATDDDLSSIKIKSASGGTHIEHGVFLGGYDAGPVPTQFSYSEHGSITNQKTQDASWADGDYRSRVNNAGDAVTFPVGFFRDGWVTPKVECAYTHWQGWAQGIGTDESGNEAVYVKKQENTKYWKVNIPLPTLWDSGVQILGLTYSYMRWLNHDRNAIGMDFDKTPAEFTSTHTGARIGKVGVLEYQGGGYFPTFRYTDKAGDVQMPKDDWGAGVRNHAYIERPDSGTSSYHDHLIIRISATTDSEFDPKHGTSKDDIAWTNDTTGPHGDYKYENSIGIRVKVLLWYARKDT
jgi:hypothetical protein